MMNTSIYLIYSHEYNTGYIGNTANLRNKFYEHCNDNRSGVKQFCNGKGVRVRDIFGMYEIIRSDKDQAAHYEGIFMI